MPGGRAVLHPSLVHVDMSWRNWSVVGWIVSDLLGVLAAFYQGLPLLGLLWQASKELEREQSSPTRTLNGCWDAAEPVLCWDLGIQHPRAAACLGVGFLFRGPSSAGDFCLAQKTAGASMLVQEILLPFVCALVLICLASSVSHLQTPLQARRWEGSLCFRLRPWSGVAIKVQAAECGWWGAASKGLCFSGLESKTAPHGACSF